MLQQTQVPRVLPKFQQFILRFPDWKSLSEASLSDVLSVWQGLGYNRRAKYLYDISRSISDNEFPISIESLVTHKGIGSNTAAAILTYSYNQRHVFIETNVRTVLIHHFCPDQQDVTDAQLEHHLLRCLNLLMIFATSIGLSWTTVRTSSNSTATTLRGVLIIASSHVFMALCVSFAQRY